MNAAGKPLIKNQGRIACKAIRPLFSEGSFKDSPVFKERPEILIVIPYLACKV